MSLTSRKRDTFEKNGNKESKTSNPQSTSRHKLNLCTRTTNAFFDLLMRNAPKIQTVKQREFSEATFIAGDQFWGYAQKALEPDGLGSDRLIVQAAPVALEDTHGRCYWRFGPSTHALMISTREDVKAIMEDHFDDIVMHDSTESFVEVIGDTIFSNPHKSEKWGTQRSLYKDMFHPDNLSAQFTAMQKLVADNFAAMEEQKGTVDVKYFANFIAMDVIGHFMGLSPAIPAPTKKKLIDALEPIMAELATHRNQTIKKYFPFLKYRPFSSCYKSKMNLMVEEGSEILKDEVIMPNAENILKTVNWLTKNGVTKDTLLAQKTVNKVKEFLFAGSETTATFIEVFLMLLADPAHKEQFSKLRKELEAMFAAHGPMSQWKENHFDKSHLPLLHSAAEEALRLYSSVPDILVEVKKEFKFAGGTLKPGDLIVISPRILQTSAKIWGSDAHQFKIERFLNADLSKIKHSHIPFGFPPRQCVGQGVARREAIMTLAKAILEYDFVLDKPLQHPFETHQVYSRRMVTHGANIVFTKRELTPQLQPSVARSPSPVLTG